MNWLRLYSVESFRFLRALLMFLLKKEGLIVLMTYWLSSRKPSAYIEEELSVDDTFRVHLRKILVDHWICYSLRLDLLSGELF